MQLAATHDSGLATRAQRDQPTRPDPTRPDPTRPDPRRGEPERELVLFQNLIKDNHFFASSPTDLFRLEWIKSILKQFLNFY